MVLLTAAQLVVPKAALTVAKTAAYWAVMKAVPMVYWKVDWREFLKAAQTAALMVG